MKKHFRKKCVVTGASDLEDLVKLEKFPIFIGATDQPAENDELYDMCWSISKSSGVIQLKELLPLEKVYSGFHSEAVGRVWEKHQQEFLSFLDANKKFGNVVEMGGSDGKTANEYCQNIDPECLWTIIEPNLAESGPVLHKNITMIEGYIETEIKSVPLVDNFVHSHVMEHLYEPVPALQAISRAQKSGDRMIFSIPNLTHYVENLFVNALNFEHTYYITEPVTEYLLTAAGYRILEKSYYENHSIFYAAERTELVSDKPNLQDSFYIKNKKDYLYLINYYRSKVDYYNQVISNHDGDVFLFGGHIFSQFLLYMGLDSSRIKSILDNSPQKVGKRLYGSTLKISKPQELGFADNPMVILKVGQYFNEVKDQILSINRKVTIVE